MQRSRIVQKVTESQTKDSIKYEKMLLEMDNRINNLLLKIHSAPPQADSIEDGTNREDELEKDKIKGIILFLLIKYNRNYCLTENQIVCEIINLGKKTSEHASNIFLELEEEEGLKYCKKFQGGKFVYDLMEFAHLRRYVLPNESFVTNVHTLYVSDIQHKEELRKLERRFVERHGTQKIWNDKIYTEYHKEREDITEGFADSQTRLVAASLEEKLDFETIKEYTKYMRVFFGDGKTTYEKILEL